MHLHLQITDNYRFGEMGSEERDSEAAVEDRKSEMDAEKKESRGEMKKKNKKRRWRRRIFILRRLSCMRILEDEYPTVDEPTGEGSFNMQAITDHTPTHLIVMVNGLIGRSVS